MPDVTLIHEDLQRLGKELFQPFSPDCVRGSSYDISVGDEVVMRNELGRDERFTIKPGHPICIHPGVACLVSSLEKVALPLNLKGKLFLRMTYAKRLIFYAGGIIDPGFHGRLRLPIVNMSDDDLVLTYGERLVTAEFTQLERCAKGYEPSSDPDTDAQPRPAFDRTKMTEDLRTVQSKLQALETGISQVSFSMQETAASALALTDWEASSKAEIAALKQDLKATQSTTTAMQWILNAFVLGAIAGAVTQASRTMDTETALFKIVVLIAIVGGVMAAGLVLLGLWVRSRFFTRKGGFQ